MDDKLQILVIGADGEKAPIIADNLTRYGLLTEVTAVSDSNSAHEAIHRQSWDLVFADAKMEHGILQSLQHSTPAVPVITITRDLVNLLADHQLAPIRMSGNTFSPMDAVIEQAMVKINERRAHVVSKSRRLLRH